MSFRTCGIAVAVLAIVFGYFADFGRSRLGGPARISDQDAGDGQQKLHPDHDTRTRSWEAEEQHPRVFNQAYLDNIFKNGQDPQGFFLPTKVPSCAGRWIHESPSGGIFATKGYEPPNEKECLRLHSTDAASAWAFRFSKEDFEKYWELDTQTDHQPCKDVDAFNGIGLRRYRSKVSYPVLIPTSKAIDAGVSFQCDSSTMHCVTGERKVSADIALLHGSLFGWKSQWIARSTTAQGWFRRQFVDCATDETKNTLLSLIEIDSQQKQRNLPTKWTLNDIFLWRHP